MHDSHARNIAGTRERAQSRSIVGEILTAGQPPPPAPVLPAAPEAPAEGTETGRCYRMDAQRLYHLLDLQFLEGELEAIAIDYNDICRLHTLRRGAIELRVGGEMPCTVTIEGINLRSKFLLAIRHRHMDFIREMDPREMARREGTDEPLVSKITLTEALPE